MPKSKKVHCFCRQEDDGLFMIYCDNCNLWFHGECVNMSKKASERISRWFCVWCTTCLRSAQKTVEEHKQLQFKVSKIQDELNQLKASVKSSNQEKPPHQQLADNAKELDKRNTCKESDIASLIQSKKVLSEKIVALEQENLLLKENLLKSTEHEKRSQDLTHACLQLEQENEGLKSKCEEISSILESKKVRSDDGIAVLQKENEQLKEKLTKSTTDHEESKKNTARFQELEKENERLLGEIVSLKSKCVELTEMLGRLKNKSRLSLSKKF